MVLPNIDLQKKWLAFKDLHAQMVATLEDDAPALSTVQKWATDFKMGRESFEDDPRSRRPATATIQENIDHVHHMVMDVKTFNPLKTSPEYTRAGVYGKCML